MPKLLIILSCILMLFVCAFLQERIHKQEAWTGTAWMLNRDGYMVTAYHVVENNKHLMVFYKGQYYPAQVVSTNKKQDLAIIKTPLKNQTPIPLNFEPAFNTPGQILGYPVPEHKGVNLKSTTGTIHSGRFSYSYITFWITICPGNSGGPVIDEYGAARGIVARGYDAYEFDSNRCTKLGDGAASKYVQRLAQQSGLSYTVLTTLEARASHVWFNTYRNSVLLVYGWN